MTHCLNRCINSLCPHHWTNLDPEKFLNHEIESKELKDTEDCKGYIEPYSEAV